MTQGARPRPGRAPSTFRAYSRDVRLRCPAAPGGSRRDADRGDRPPRSARRSRRTERPSDRDPDALRCPPEREVDPRHGPGGSRETAGSSVSVTIPAGYAVTIETGDLTTGHGSDGSTILSTDVIPDPQSFFAYITAERPGAFHQTSTTIRLPEGPVTVQIRAW